MARYDRIMATNQHQIRPPLHRVHTSKKDWQCRNSRQCSSSLSRTTLYRRHRWRQRKVVIQRKPLPIRPSRQQLPWHHSLRHPSSNSFNWNLSHLLRRKCRKRSTCQCKLSKTSRLLDSTSVRFRCRSKLSSYSSSGGAHKGHNEPQNRLTARPGSR